MPQMWFLIALIAPLLWAIVNIIDVYFVESIYEDEFDGAMISGIFQVVPWILVPFGIIHFTFPAAFPAMLALIGGVLFQLSYFMYFRSLFRMNDGAVIQTLWLVNVLLVPVFAWFITGERLEPIHYLALVIGFLGAVTLAFDEGLRSSGLWKVVPTMAPAVVFLSLSMVLQERAYSESAGSFWDIFLLFSLGGFAFALLLVLGDKKHPIVRLKHIAKMSRRYVAAFLAAEMLALFGILSSQYAIDLSPAVSYVALIENLQPVFVLLGSLVLAIFFHQIRKQVARDLFARQLRGVVIKVISVLIIAFSVYLVS